MAAVGRIVAIASAGIMILACLFYILSNALPSWGSAKTEAVTATLGLWRGCVTDAEGLRCIKSPTTCSQVEPESRALCNKMIVARAFVTIACILSALSVLCLVAYAVIRTELNRIVLIVGKVLPFVSLIAGIIGVAVGIAFIVQSSSEILFKISDAAVLGITAVAGNIIGAILALMIR